VNYSTKNHKKIKDGWFFNPLLADIFVNSICRGSLPTYQTFNDQKKVSEQACVIHGLLTGELSEREIRYVLDKGITRISGKPFFDKEGLKEACRLGLLAGLNTAGHGIYLMLNEGDGRGRAKANVVRVRAVFVDLDGAPLKPVLDWELKPHIVNETSPDRYHAIWLVDGMSPERFRAVQIALAEKFNGDNSNRDPSRVVRIPGLWNKKREKFFLIRMIGKNEHPPYRADELLKTLDIPERVKARKFALQTPLSDKMIPIGHRNNSLASLAGAMRRKGMSEPAINAALQLENERCEKPLDPQEVTNIAKSISRYEPESDEFHKTHLGNAKRLVVLHGADLRFCEEFGWLVWDGRRWSPDKTGEVYRRAKDTVLGIYAEATRIAVDELRKERIAFAMKCEHRTWIEAMVKLAESEMEMVVRPEDFDSDPFLLNCLNGTLDLRTGEFRAHSRNDFITKIAAVEYNPEAKCPLWKEFLSELFDGDKKLIRYMQKALGYCATCEISEHTWFFLYGTGANGKSTFINTVLHVYGEYGCQTPPDTFLVRRGDGPRNDLARLQGSRFIAASEPEGSKRLDDGIIKMFTGGDPITTRFLYKELFTYLPVGKLFFSANHKPRVADNSRGFWRRVAMIPFDITISEKEQDKGLIEKLKAEGPGILAWMVRGCLAWQKNGLGKPEAVREAGEEYQEETNPLADFLRDRSLVRGPSRKIQKNDLYDHYKDIGRGANPLSKIDFNRILSGQFKDRRVGHDRVLYWIGIGLRSSFKKGDRPQNKSGKPA
jgi:putative DNA primase/helicase